MSKLFSFDSPLQPLIVTQSNWKETSVFQEACRLIRVGFPVAVPTETVYGLAADARCPQACARIYTFKGRPASNPLIVHLASLAQAEALAHFSPLARRLGEIFWPGPLTLVLPKREGAALSPCVTAGRPTVALRVPDAPVMTALSLQTGCPLAAPSANLSGRLSPTTAEAVAEDLGSVVPLILDTGPVSQGIESTILRVEDNQLTLLRPGALPCERIESLLGLQVRRLQSRVLPSSDVVIEAPGMLSVHYAARTRLRLNAEEVLPGEALLAFGAPLPTACRAVGTENLSTTGDLFEAGKRLFVALRRLDQYAARAIAVMPIPKLGLGEALNDRLQRAAQGLPQGGH